MSSLLRPYLTTLFVSAAAVAVLLPLHGLLAPANIAMLLLLLVAVVAARLGRGPGIFASLLGVVAFDLGFVPPRGSFSAEDSEYLIVFAVMLAVALIISQVSGTLRQGRLQAQASETQQRRLYELAAQLNASLRSEQVIAIVSAFMRTELDGTITFHPSDPAVEARTKLYDPVESSVAAADDDDLERRPHRHVYTLQGATRSRGLLELHLPRPGPTIEQLAIMELMADLMAAALERLHYLEVAARVQSEVEAERLRNVLLSSLSHDLRTPLTVLYGQADRLREQSAGKPELARQAARVCEEALRVSRLCEGLLDLARVRTLPNLLHCEWVALEELIGSALADLRGVAGIEHLRIEVPADLPWLQLDAQMFERVIVNLVDNALKRGDDSQQVSIIAQTGKDAVTLTVANTGSRFPEDAHTLLQQPAAPGMEQARGGSERGFGLGLAICKAVIEAHAGTIALSNSAEAAQVVVTLPLPAQIMSQPPLESEHVGALI